MKLSIASNQISMLNRNVILEVGFGMGDNLKFMLENRPKIIFYWMRTIFKWHSKPNFKIA